MLAPESTGTDPRLGRDSPEPPGESLTRGQTTGEVGSAALGRFGSGQDAFEAVPLDEAVGAVVPVAALFWALLFLGFFCFFLDA